MDIIRRYIFTIAAACPLSESIFTWDFWHWFKIWRLKPSFISEAKFLGIELIDLSNARTEFFVFAHDKQFSVPDLSVLGSLDGLILLIPEALLQFARTKTASSIEKDGLSLRFLERSSW